MLQARVLAAGDAETEGGLSKAWEARRTDGGFAELSGDKGKPIVSKCERCAAPLNKRGKRYCLPCASERYDETVAANKAKYRAQKLASKT